VQYGRTTPERGALCTSCATEKKPKLPREKFV
jgi:hypothetical protein